MPSGNVVNAYTYDVYGKKTSSSGSQANDFDFAGQQSDTSTGLQYLRARYYDTATGTFISRVPMSAGPSWLRSSDGYAGANPVNAADPTGLEQIWVDDEWGGYYHDTDTNSNYINGQCGTRRANTGMILPTLGSDTHQSRFPLSDPTVREAETRGSATSTSPN